MTILKKTPSLQFGYTWPRVHVILHSRAFINFLPYLLSLQSFLSIFSHYLLLVLSLSFSVNLSRSWLPLGLCSAKLMNGYLALANGRPISPPVGDININMETDIHVKKIETVVKLDAVSMPFVLTFS